MLLNILYLLVLLLCEVKSDEFSESWKEMNNATITDVKKYCKDKNCIPKCCPEGNFMAPTKDGVKCFKPRNPKVASLINNLKVDLNRENGSSAEVKVKKNVKPIHFIQNDILADPNKTVNFHDCDFHILEDGFLSAKSPCINLPKLQYCVDYFYNGWKNTTSGRVANILLTYRAVIQNDPDAKSKHDFVAAGMLTSSFFMMLVVLVYSALPRLRNIVGMVLMAYLSTLTVAFTMKAVQLMVLTASVITAEQCRIFSPAVYYFIIASFFWLNVMSFDLMWTIRGTRKSRDIHRQGELMKFFWYALYAWGTSALLTLSVVLVDRNVQFKNNDYKPPFDSCFVDNIPTALYMHLPIGIMTVINILLFLLTAFNVWLVKRAVSNSKDSRNTKNSENRFAIYIKLSVLMGVSWILELLPDMSLVPHILVNFYNMFIGVAIFLLFVCKKSIITMLCRRFNINNRYVAKLQASQYSKSETTKSSASKKDRRSQREDADATEMTSYAVEAGSCS